MLYLGNLTGAWRGTSVYFCSSSEYFTLSSRRKLCKETSVLLVMSSKYLRPVGKSWTQLLWYTPYSLYTTIRHEKVRAKVHLIFRPLWNVSKCKATKELSFWGSRFTWCKTFRHCMGRRGMHQNKMLWGSYYSGNSESCRVAAEPWTVEGAIPLDQGHIGFLQNL